MYVCAYVESFAKGYLPSAISFRDEMQFVQFFTLVCKAFDLYLHIDIHRYFYANVFSRLQVLVHANFSATKLLLCGLVWLYTFCCTIFAVLVCCCYLYTAFEYEYE